LLNQAGIITKTNFYSPEIPSEEVFLQAHSKNYLQNLKRADVIAAFTEMPFLRYIPGFISYNRVVTPAFYATGGSILAGELALKYGWAINLSGGYHHASSDHYGGFCAIADITLLIKELKRNHPKIKKVLIVDLDAHQGNGHERDFRRDSDVYILDMYNASVYPQDLIAKNGIDLDVGLEPFTGDKAYLSLLSKSLQTAFDEANPDLVVYVAGTDVLQGDPLGQLSLTPNGVLKRDEMVFQSAIRRNVPIVMLLSGGYQPINAKVIADSIQNLIQSFSLNSLGQS